MVHPGDTQAGQKIPGDSSLLRLGNHEGPEVEKAPVMGLAEENTALNADNAGAANGK